MMTAEKDGVELPEGCPACGALPIDWVCGANPHAFCARPTPAQEQGKYLVWSNEHRAWWGKDHCGYTRIIANAGRYDRDEALKIAGTRDGGWRLNKGNPDEIAIPEQDAIDQYADITAAQPAPSEEASDV